MNIKSLLFLLGILAFSASSFSQKTELETLPDGLIWEITHPDNKSKSYLFGTIHLLSKEDFVWSKQLDKRVKKVEEVILEIDDINQSLVFELIQLKEGSLFDYFSSEQKDSILTYGSDKMGITAAQFEFIMGKMKPFAAAQTLEQFDLVKDNKSYDLEILSLAKELNLQTYGLETINDQINLFESLDSLTQAEMVMDVIRNADKSHEIQQQLVHIYLDQNVDELYHFIQDEGFLSPEFEANFIDNRNKRWLDLIIKEMETKNVFIAVGAGHLGGENGLVRLLTQEGYKLKPIKL